MKATKQTIKINKPLRFAHSNSALRRITTSTPEAFRATIRDYVNARKKERNTIIINTKRTRPVFVDRENPDTPPAITDSTRETASLMRNSNSLIAHFTIPGLEDFANLYMWAVVDENDASIMEKRTRTPDPNRVAVKMHFLTARGNINPESKPAFRPDWLLMFDNLSEDYSA